MNFIFLFINFWLICLNLGFGNGSLRNSATFSPQSGLICGSCQCRQALLYVGNTNSTLVLCLLHDWLRVPKWWQRHGNRILEGNHPNFYYCVISLSEVEEAHIAMDGRIWATLSWGSGNDTRLRQLTKCRGKAIFHLKIANIWYLCSCAFYLTNTSSSRGLYSHYRGEGEWKTKGMVFRILCA